MDQAVIVLVVVGFLLIAAEVFVPGMVLGAAGGISLLASIVLGYIAHGPLVGSLMFVGIAMVTGTGFIIWMKTFARTSIGRQIILRSPESPVPATAENSLVGASGVALTALRPSGTARIGTHRVDVVADGAFIEAGASITVFAHEGLRILVRPSGVPDTGEKRG